LSRGATAPAAASRATRGLGGPLGPQVQLRRGLGWRREDEGYEVLELLEVAGLGYVGEDPGVEDLDHGAQRLLARDDDHGDRAVEGAHLLEQREPLEALHLRVEQDQIGAAVLEGGGGLGGVRRRVDPVPLSVVELSEVALQRLQLWRW